MSKPFFRFALGKTQGVAYSTIADRVGISINHIDNPVVTSMTMSATEARAMANALYEAAEASERVPVAVMARAEA